MRGSLIRAALGAAAVVLAVSARADTVSTTAEPPKAASPAPPGPFLRASQYDVWQFYAVDRFGGFRPRVVYSPFGSYYLYNGRAYSWLTNNQRDVMPYALD